MKTKEKYGLSKHEERFGTEEKCREFLIQQRWDGRPTCPNCKNNHMNYYISSRKIWKCSSCKSQFSLTKGTIFENTNLPLKTWFKAIFYFTTHKRGVSSCQLAEWLEIEQRSAWFILHRLREVTNAENNTIELSGIVEADETSVGPQIGKDTRLQRAKKKHDEEQERIHGLSKAKKRRLRGEPAKRGRKKGSTKEVLAQKKREREAKGERVPFEKDVVILGMTERAGRVVLKKLGRTDKSKTKENIYPHLKKHISSSAILYTDQLNLYDDTIKHFKDHRSVNHDEKYVDGEVHTNSIENVWKHFKKVIDGTYFHMSYHHFDNYLSEHAFRWNRIGKSSREKVDDFLSQIEGKRLKYVELIGRGHNPFIKVA